MSRLPDEIKKKKKKKKKNTDLCSFEKFLHFKLVSKISRKVNYLRWGLDTCSADRG